MRSSLPFFLLRPKPSVCSYGTAYTQVLNMIASWAFRSVVWTEITQFLAWECRAEAAVLNSSVRTALDKVAVQVV
jgi:hypothetical protein